MPVVHGWSISVDLREGSEALGTDSEVVSAAFGRAGCLTAAEAVTLGLLGHQLPLDLLQPFTDDN